MLKHSQSDHWDDYYDQGKDFGLITAEMLDKLLSYAKPSIPKNALDVGCGTGQLTRELNHRGYRCVGIDASTIAIEKAKKNAAYNEALQYLIFDIEKDSVVALPRSPYSLITCKLVYAFIKDKNEFLKKVKQLLVSEGLFVIITPILEEQPDKPAIAVSGEQTMEELRNYFQDIQTFKGRGVTYFICRG